MNYLEKGKKKLGDIIVHYLDCLNNKIKKKTTTNEIVIAAKTEAYFEIKHFLIEYKKLIGFTIVL